MHTRPSSSPVALDHCVYFYRNDHTLAIKLAATIGDALEHGDAAVVLATPEHRATLLSDLGVRGLDANRYAHNARLLLLDARTMYNNICAHGSADPERFAATVGGIMQFLSCGTARRVVAFGEMVALAWDDGRPEEAMAVEQMWNRLALEHRFKLLCAYPLKHFARIEDEESFLKICSAHHSVVTDPSPTE